VLFKIGVGKRRQLILVGNGKLALVGSARDEGIKAFKLLGTLQAPRNPWIGAGVDDFFGCLS
jgi:hypothetical protein